MNEPILDERDDYVAWLTFRKKDGTHSDGRLRICDSDSPGAFRVYRAAPISATLVSTTDQGADGMIKREELSNPQSCMSRARDEEMTFVLLGRDAAAPVAIRAWCAERVRIGKNAIGDAQIQEALACANAMEYQG